MNEITMLTDFSEQFGISLDGVAIKRFELYAQLLKEWNEKINLTAITDESGIYLKHFADSLSIFAAADFPNSASVIDVGTGAGFPGLAMKIARPDLKLTLLDSTRKKLGVIDDIQQHLGLECELVHARAEVLQRQAGYKSSFDFAVARAVANLKTLSGWCLPFVKVGGTFIAMKGAKADEEIKEAELAIRKLGSSIEKIHSFQLAGAGERNIIVMRKIK